MEDPEKNSVQVSTTLKNTKELDFQKISNPRQALIESLAGGQDKKYLKFAMAVIGSIPWFGGLLTAAANLHSAVGGLLGEAEQERINTLLALWIEEHEIKIKRLKETLDEIYSRFDEFGEEIQTRIESPEYLSLVRKTFRCWDQADTEQKRQMYKKLLIGAGVTTLCPDDLLRLFIDWIDRYHEAHFSVMKVISDNPGITKKEIWDKIHGQLVRDDSPEAGLFNFIIRELSFGGIAHQETEVNQEGRALKKVAQKNFGHATKNPFRESPFENTKPLVLTSLGRDFVHYVLKDVVMQISSNSTRSHPDN